MGFLAPPPAAAPPTGCQHSNFTIKSTCTCTKSSQIFDLTVFFFLAAAAIASGSVGAKAPSADRRTQRIALRKQVVRCCAARAPIAHGGGRDGIKNLTSQKCRLIFVLLGTFQAPTLPFQRAQNLELNVPDDLPTRWPNPGRLSGRISPVPP